MKLDYNFIKKILITMEEYKEHQIYSYDLMKLLNITDDKGVINEQQIDKFIGHIKILGDNNFIACSAAGGKFGFSYGANGDLMITNPKYRITAQGYEFLDVLKKDNILSQIADLAVPTAFKIGTQLLTQTLWEKIKNGI